MMLHEQVVARLQQETHRISQKRYRTRGNSGYILKLVAQVKRKCCRTCGDTRHVELHHENGDWRNYSLDNLNWYCVKHHQQLDNILQEKHIMKNIVKRGNIQWNAEMIQKLKYNITRRIVGNPNQKMSAVYADIAKNSLQIFGKKLGATHIQKRASFLGVAPNGRKNKATIGARFGAEFRNTAARDTRTSGVTLMYAGRCITEEMLQKALRLYDAAYPS